MKYLYILMRRDLYDMNPGKGMAQAAHAANDFQSIVFEKYNVKQDYMKWVEDRNFGTTIVLEATLEQIERIELIAADTGIPAGIVVDPTYPFRNFYGEVFTAKEVTCAWLFFERDTNPDIDSLMDELKLHR